MRPELPVSGRLAAGGAGAAAGRTGRPACARPSAAAGPRADGVASPGSPAYPGLQ